MSIATVTSYSGNLQHEISMARYSSWQAGGNARNFYQPLDKEDLMNFIVAIKGESEIYLTGLGSNLLVRDGGYPGTIIRLAPGLKKLNLPEQNLIYAEAGVAMPKLAKFASANNLGVAGFMAGIPGSVGGALAMNAGCFGASTWEYVTKVLIIDDEQNLIEATADEFNISYRQVSHNEFSNILFIAAWFKFPNLVEGELKKNKEILAQRENTQPIGTSNAGSVFINPNNDSAGRLIEDAKLKGYQIGNAQVSKKHGNFIINLGGATAADIEDLIIYVHDQVLANSGIDLKLEVKIIGERL